MIQREVTVGRAPDSDILYDPNCVHISNAHAVIYSNGSQLIFKDTSTMVHLLIMCGFIINLLLSIMEILYF